MANKIEDIPFGLLAPVDKLLTGVKEQIPGEVSNIENLLNAVEEVMQPDILRGVHGDAFRKIKLRTETDAPRTTGGPIFKRFICRQPEMDACIPYNGTTYGTPTNFDEVQDDHYFIEMHADGGKLDIMRMSGEHENIEDGQILQGGYGNVNNMSAPFISVATDFRSAAGGTWDQTAFPRGNFYFPPGGKGNAVSHVGPYSHSGVKWRNPTNCVQEDTSNIKAGSPAYANRLFKEADKLIGYRVRHCWAWTAMVHVHACLHPSNWSTSVFRPGQRKAWAVTNSKGVYVGPGKRPSIKVFSGNHMGIRHRKYRDKRKYPHQFMPKTDAFFNKIKPGDWIMYWNGNSSPLGGHSILFKRWINKGKRLAEVYSQPSNTRGGRLHQVDFTKRRASIFQITRTG